MTEIPNWLANYRNDNSTDSLAYHTTVYVHFDERMCYSVLKELVERLRGWERELHVEIAEAEASGDDVGRPALLHESVYRDVAVSHAVLASVTAFVEGAVRHGFARMRELHELEPFSKTHSRWSMKADDFWDQKKTTHGRPGIAMATVELINALGIDAHFPKKLEGFLIAVFAFRNESMHNGYEWLPDRRAKFKARAEAEGWAHWVQWATSGGEPWIAYMAPQLIDDAIVMCESIIEGFQGAWLSWLRKYRA